MPHEIKFTWLPGGYAAQHARPGDSVKVIHEEFTSSEDGNLFVTRLEGLPRDIIAKIPGAHIAMEATLDHLLAIIRPDGSTTVFINDLPHSVSIRAKRAIKAGDPVTLDDILDVTGLNLIGVVVPPEAGIVAVLSSGWRKGMYFDLTPLHGDRVPRCTDISVTLGKYYAYLSFQQKLSMKDSTWDEFFKQGWFPFAHLRHETVSTMIKWADAGFSLDENLDVTAKEVKESVGQRIDSWKDHPVLASHHALFSAAYRNFCADDFVSATAILYPRIEGVLRTNHLLGPAAATKASQAALVSSTFANAPLPAHSNSLLLPDRFRRYLENVYFAHFDPKTPNGLSRNTVSHGVAPSSVFDRKGAVLGFLILLQIVALLPLAVPSNKPTPPASQS